MLVLYRNGTDATLEPVRPDGTTLSGRSISVDGLFGQSISRSGHRIAAGTDRGVEIYDGFTGELVGHHPGDDLRGVFITVDRPALRQLTRRRAHPVRPRHASNRSARSAAAAASSPTWQGTADGTLIATNGGDHSVILYDVATGVRIGTPITIPDDESNSDLPVARRPLAGARR